MPLTITNPFEQDGQEANNVSINAKAVMIEGLVTDLKKDYDDHASQIQETSAATLATYTDLFDQADQRAMDKLHEEANQDNLKYRLLERQGDLQTFRQKNLDHEKAILENKLRERPWYERLSHALTGSTKSGEKVSSAFGAVKSKFKASPEAQAEKARQKEKKKAEKDREWKASTKKWRRNLAGNIGKAITDNPIMNFLKNHWGKLALLFGALFLKPEQMKAVWNTLMEGMNWLWKNGPTLLKDTFEALKEWIPKIGTFIGDIFEWFFGTKNEDGERTGGVFGKDASLMKQLLVGTGGFLWFLNKFGPAGSVSKVFELGIAGVSKSFGLMSKYAMPQGGPGLGPRVAGGLGTKVMGAGAILAGVALAIKDGFAGAELSKEWEVGKASGVAGAVLGGTEQGLEGAMSNMGKWALIGAGIGSFVPVIGTLIGGLIGAAIGALLGWIGGKRIAKFFNGVGEFFSKMWDTVWNGFMDLGKDFKTYLIDPWWNPLVETLKKIKNWTTELLKKILPDSVIEFFGIGDDTPPGEKKITSESGEVTNDTNKDQRDKWRRDFKAREEAEDLGFMDSTWFTGSVKDLTEDHKAAMVAGINNGKLKREHLVAMIDAGDLGEEDTEFLKTMMQQFPKTVKPKAVRQTKTAPDEASDPIVSLPDMSDESKKKIKNLRDAGKSKHGTFTKVQRAEIALKKQMLKDPEEAKAIWSSLSIQERNLGQIRQAAVKQGIISSRMSKKGDASAEEAGFLDSVQASVPPQDKISNQQTLDAKYSSSQRSLQGGMPVIINDNSSKSVSTGGGSNGMVVHQKPTATNPKTAEYKQ